MLHFLKCVGCFAINGLTTIANSVLWPVVYVGRFAFGTVCGVVGIASPAAANQLHAAIEEEPISDLDHRLGAAIYTVTMLICCPVATVIAMVLAPIGAIATWMCTPADELVALRLVPATTKRTESIVR